ncbi:MAG: MFS transporter [Candidatus Thorarchaeota archaeon]|jgi:DHA1 family tetracycline resistance protein-like MFS transporter
MGLRASEHRLTLIALYLVTLIMRASFYVTIAVIQSHSYLGGLNEWEVAAVLIVYPVTELATVSFFGSYSDKIGRKPILIASLFVTSAAAFLFSVAPTAAFLLPFAAIFGLGAASKVTTTLSMIADASGEGNRARLMGYYDLSTLVGLAGGYGLGVILLQFGYEAMLILMLAGTACAISGIIGYFTIQETRKHVQIEARMSELLRKVAGDRRIQRMLPVYVPIISLYGLLIANVERIIEEHFSLSNIDMLILFGILGGALILGIITMGHLSDHVRKRRPFIVTGLIGFGFLAYILVGGTGAGGIENLWAVWPLLPILGFIAGSFPPAAMAYLTDVSEEDSRGSTMGVYSIFFGSGMIIGPATGAYAYSVYGLPGLAVLVALLIGIACLGTYFMPEALEVSVSEPIDH